MQRVFGGGAAVADESSMPRVKLEASWTPSTDGVSNQPSIELRASVSPEHRLSTPSTQPLLSSAGGKPKPLPTPPAKGTPRNSLITAVDAPPWNDSTDTHRRTSSPRNRRTSSPRPIQPSAKKREGSLVAVARRSSLADAAADRAPVTATRRVSLAERITVPERAPVAASKTSVKKAMADQSTADDGAAAMANGGEISLEDKISKLSGI